MTCTKCGSEIRQGETRVVVRRSIECETLPGVVEVADASVVEAYHDEHEPDA